MKRYLKEKVRNSDTLLFVLSCIYNIIHISYPFYGKFSGVFIKKIKFDIRGKNVSIRCGKRSRLINCHFVVIGNNINIVVGDKCLLKNLELYIEDNNGSIYIGRDTTMEGGQIAVTEGGSVEIGENCMFSSNVQIRNGDSHSIFDLLTNNRINYAQSVKIGTNVWLGTNTTVLKGVIIADNSIIGTGSLVNSPCLEKNSIYAGIPAKKIKDNVYWTRLRYF